MTFNWFNETLLYVVIWTNNEENAKFFTDTSSKVMTSSLPVSYNLHAKHRVFEMTTERGWLYSRSFFETHPVHVSSPFLRNSLDHLPSLINIKTDREREISSRLWMQTRPIESDNINTKKMISSIRKTVYIDRDYLYAEWRIVSIRIIICSWKKMATCYWNFHRHTRRKERERERKTRLSLPYRRITVCDKPINPVNNCRIISTEMKRCFA